jgi:PAS domain S-box-containing protein
VVLAVLAVLMLRWPLLGGEMPFLLFWPAVMACAWYGGLRAGLLATALAVLSTVYLALEPPRWFALTTTSDWVGIALFVPLGCAVSLLCDMLHRAKEKSERQAEQALRQREWFAGTLASIGDAVVATDVGGCVTFTNAVAQALTGWKQAESAGRAVEEIFHIVHERTRAAVDSPVQAVLRTGCVTALAGHTALVARGGTEVPIDGSAAPIRSGDGTLLGVVLVFRDVTGPRRLEQELRQRAVELAEANRHKNEFLGMLGHELRNPLASLRNAVEVLQLGHKGNGDLHYATEVLDRQSKQLARLVDDLLDVSRIASGKLRLRKERVELAEVVALAVETSRPLIKALDHELEVVLPGEPLWLEADPARLAQVIGNLLNNAAKYTEKGGHIRLTAEQESGEVVCRVQDNGVGIAPDMLDRIFDLFAQVDDSADRSLGGLGIGLNLARKLIDLHGGSIRAFSDGPGKGSEFVLWLPLVRGPSGAKPEHSVVQGENGVTSSRRILVVDDNVDAARSLAVLLRAMGNEVLTAPDGPAALQAAATFHPDVAVLDLGLPGMDGCSVARQLKCLPGLEHVLLVALTGFGQPSDRCRTREAGFAHHLLKPVELDELQELLASAGAGAICSN